MGQVGSRGQIIRVIHSVRRSLGFYLIGGGNEASDTGA